MGSNWPKAGFANEFQCEPAALPAAAAASRRADGPPVRRIRRYMVAAMVEALALGRLLGENPWLGGWACRRRSRERAVERPCWQNETCKQPRRMHRARVQRHWQHGRAAYVKGTGLQLGQLELQGRALRRQNARVLFPAVRALPVRVNGCCVVRVNGRAARRLSHAAFAACGDATCHARSAWARAAWHSPRRGARDACAKLVTLAGSPMPCAGCGSRSVTLAVRA